MIYKSLSIPAVDSNNNQRVTPLFGLEKLGSTADSGKKKNNFSRELNEAIAKIVPSPKYSFVVITPIGAHEYWGPNDNGDSVLEEHLEAPKWKTCKIYKLRPYGYRTFLNGKAFAHHKNKPQEGHPVYGDIIFANYNKAMHWVEILVKFYREPLGKEHPDILNKIDSGTPFSVSMGLYAVADVCPICGNTRRRPEDPKCVHVAPRHLNTIMKDGRVCCMINLYPKFHDISVVDEGADSLAYGLLKVASKAVQTGVLASQIPVGPIKRTVDRLVKRGILRKAGKIPPSRPTAKVLEKRSIVRQMLELFSKEAGLDHEKLMDAGERYGSSVLLSAVNHRIMLTPDEFCSLYLSAAGERGKAERMLRAGITIPPPESIPELEVTAESAMPAVDKWVRSNLMDRSILSIALQDRLREGPEDAAEPLGWGIQKNASLETAYARYLGMVAATPERSIPRRDSMYGMASDRDILDVEKTASIFGGMIASPSLVVPLWFIARGLSKKKASEREQAEYLNALLEKAVTNPKKGPTIIIPPPMPDLRPTALPYDLLKSLGDSDEDD